MNMNFIAEKIIAGPPIREIFALEFGTELIYSFIIILCSLMVYFGTKELYELSSHKGIKYFRQAFLFFAIAYFVRSFIKFVINYFEIRAIIDLPPHIAGATFGKLTLFLFMYFSAMAILYLLYSVIKTEKLNILGFHAIAIIIATISIIFQNNLVYLLLNIIIFLFLTIILLLGKKQSRKKRSNLYIVYILLFIFWILNLIDILIPNFFQTFQLLIYLSSITIFVLILYKVLKNTGVN